METPEIGRLSAVTLAAAGLTVARYMSASGDAFTIRVQSGSSTQTQHRIAYGDRVSIAELLDLIRATVDVDFLADPDTESLIVGPCTAQAGLASHVEVLLSSTKDIQEAVYDPPAVPFLVVDATSSYNDADALRLRVVGPDATGNDASLLQSAFCSLYRNLLNRSSNTLLRDLCLVDARDLDTIHRWNQRPLWTADYLIHDLITQRAEQQPCRPAVHTSHGHLTYAQLERLSSQLASFLVEERGVRPTDFVPLCFEKSWWTVIAMLAVLKAGAAFIPLEPSQPVDRLQNIATQSAAKLVLACSVHVQTARKITDQVLLIDEGHFNRHATTPTQSSKSLASRTTDAAYMIFTSGTSGTAKGVIIEHKQISTSALLGGHALGFGPATRMLQFASYSFDACIMEILTTLAYGGCVCVPSDYERMNDLTGFMNHADVTTALLTPSLLGTLVREDLKTLDTLILGGEAVPKDLVSMWSQNVRVFVAYGPTECTVACSYLDTTAANAWNNGDIGRHVGAHSWIVDPEDSDRLLPIGMVGELLVEGPILARCYINDQEMTDQRFIRSPKWMHRSSRLYRTGDLVRYNADGSIRFICRKDGQAKIRGQRLELGEIEYQIRSLLHPLQVDVAVGIVNLQTGTGDPALVACVTTPKTESDPTVHASSIAAELAVAARPMPNAPEYSPTATPLDLKQQQTTMLSKMNGSYRLQSNLPPKTHNSSSTSTSPSVTSASIMESFTSDTSDDEDDEVAAIYANAKDEFQSRLATLQQSLRSRLPEYMVPSRIIQLDKIPLAISGKIDRRELRRIVSKYLPTRQPEVDESDFPGCLPPVLQKMRTLWTAILSVSPGKIGPDTNFFGIGGNSIHGIRLVSLAKRGGISMSISDILTHPTLGDLANHLHQRISAPSLPLGTVEPFSLIADDEHVRTMSALSCRVDIRTIADIYPCTPLQESMMAISQRIPETYMMRLRYELKATTDIGLFKAAWQRVVHQASILRTRIVQSHTGEFLQVVVSGDISWNMTSANAEIKVSRPAFGDPLTRYFVCHDDSGAPCHFVWEAHHAVIDGWSARNIVQNVQRAYLGMKVQSGLPFNQFVASLTRDVNIAACKEFWVRRLANATPSAFPALPRKGHQPLTSAQFTSDRRTLTKPEAAVTSAVVIQAAWSLIVARYSCQDDVVFGQILSGRRVDLPGIDSMVGPAIVTVPMRASIDKSQSVWSFLHSIQQDSAEMIPYEHFGLARILLLGSEAEASCAFQNLLVIHPGDDTKQDKQSPIMQQVGGNGNVTNYSLLMECAVDADKIQVRAQYDPAAIDKTQIARLVGQFEHAIDQISTSSSDTTLADISMISPTDILTIESWNAVLPQGLPMCYLDLLLPRMSQHLDAPAVHAWDGEFSYGQLHDASARLAKSLQHWGVRPGCIVPTCFEKSKWAIVAMLAVMLAGGACLSLDPAHPTARRRRMIEQSGATLVVCSQQYEGLFDSTDYKLMIVDACIQATPASEPCILPNVSPTDPAYVVFTSGSSGEPKGIIIEHQAFTNSIVHHGRLMGLGRSSRILQFAAFTFDISFSDIFATLAHGGCVCIPSDADRLNRLEESMQEYQVNGASLTTSVAQHLRPERVPSLTMLTIAGEAPCREVLQRWSERVNLINLYGPAECTIYSCGRAGIRKDDHPHNMGWGVGTRLWIVEPDNQDRLAPIGTIGELWIEGPLLARSYLNDEAKTAAAFVHKTCWLQEDDSEDQRRFYKTGDLAQYASDGSIIYCGRKDTQVKIRGQRVELGEIEYQINKSIGPDFKAAVEVVTPMGLKTGSVIAAFVAPRTGPMDDATSVDLLLDTSGDRTLFTALDVALRMALPSYMMPTAYVLLRMLPVSASGKMERKLLRKIASGGTLQELSHHASDVPEAVQNEHPWSSQEQYLRKMWSGVLEIDEPMISRSSSFFQLGGDSMKAMQLTAMCRDDGTLIRVQDIISSPVLQAMSEKLSATGSRTPSRVETMSLVPPHAVAAITGAAEAQCGVSSSAIEDIYPCLASQSGSLSFSRWWPDKPEAADGFRAHVVYRLPANLDVDRFRNAWDMIIAENEVWRCRHIEFDGDYLQVVLRDVGSWVLTENLEEYLIRDKLTLMRPGDPLVRRCIVTTPGSSERHFVLTMSHAVYDGWSLNRVFKDVTQAYYDGFRRTVSRPSFKHLVRHALNTDRAPSEIFWKRQFRDETLARRRSMSLAPMSQRATTHKQCHYHIEFPDVHQLPADITLTTVVYGAWALLLARKMKTASSTLRLIRMGRDMPLDGIEKIIGPAFVHVPLQVAVLAQANVLATQFLQGIQEITSAMIPHAQHGWCDIRRLSEAAQAACDTALMINMQPPNFSNAFPMPEGVEMVHEGQITPHPASIGLDIVPTTNGLDVEPYFDSHYLSEQAIARITRQFHAVFLRLSMSQEEGTTVAEVMDCLDGNDGLALSVSSDSTSETITLLDNGGCEESKSSETSSALVIHLDRSLDPWVATVRMRWTRPDNGRSDKRGNFQLLPNGNTFIGWSENSYISEHSPDGELLMEAQFTSDRFVTYRAYKFNFTSAPAEPPVLKGFAYGESPEKSVSVYYVSWNGATEVSHWEFYTQDREFLGRIARSGFETIFQQTSHYADQVYARAISADGSVLEKSEMETITNPAGWPVDHALIESILKAAEEDNSKDEL